MIVLSDDDQAKEIFHRQDQFKALKIRRKTAMQTSILQEPGSECPAELAQRRALACG
jgi:hypothetical protein